MPHLTFDRSVPLSEQRLRVALSKSGRKKGKNHGTGRKSATVRAHKKYRIAMKIAAMNKAVQSYKRRVHTYWNGEGCHPTLRGVASSGNGDGNKAGAIYESVSKVVFKGLLSSAILPNRLELPPPLAFVVTSL